MTDSDHVPQRIVDIALAAMEGEEHYSGLPLEQIVRIVIAAVADSITADVNRLREEHDRMRIGISRALYQIDCGPQMVNDRVEEHWGVVAQRAAGLLRTAQGGV